MKDPAFLFYSNDFLSGTYCMTDEQVGKYIRLICLQHQKGSLKEKDMLNICKSYDEDIFSKFVKDNNNYYNQRLQEEMEKRHKYSESRKNNRLGKKDMNNICKSYDKHMEDEDEYINKDINILNINEEKLQKVFVECIGNTNLYSIQECLSFLDDLDYELIEYALKKTASRNGNWAYAKTILNNWVNNKIDTIEKVKAEELSYKTNKVVVVETEQEKIDRMTRELEESLNGGKNE